MRAISERSGLAVIAATGLPPRRALPGGLVGLRRAGRAARATGSSRTSPTACTRPTGTTRRCRSTWHGPARSRAAPRTTTSAARNGAGSRRSGRRRPRPAPRSSSTPRSGRPAHEIVDLLESAGATTDRIALAHLDRNPDWELHAEVAARGVTLEYDTIGRTKYHPDSVVLDLLERVAGGGPPRPARARPGPRRRLVPARLRRRAGHALPHDDVRPAAPAASRRRRRRPGSSSPTRRACTRCPCGGAAAG